jgi:hypothetical protein
MRRLAVLLGIVLVAFASSVVAVAATGTTTLTGTSEWPGQFTDPVTVTVIHGTFAGSLGKGTYEGTLTGGPTYFSPDCGFAVSGCQPVTGAITFSGHRGSFTGVVQPGSFVGIEDFHPRFQSRTFSLTLLVTDGTRGYAHADGSLLTLSYHSERRVEFTEDFQIVITISDSGTLTGDLR